MDRDRYRYSKWEVEEKKEGGKKQGQLDKGWRKMAWWLSKNKKHSWTVGWERLRPWQFQLLSVNNSKSYMASKLCLLLIASSSHFPHSPSTTPPTSHAFPLSNSLSLSAYTGNKGQGDIISHIRSHQIRFSMLKPACRNIFICSLT